MRFCGLSLFLHLGQLENHIKTDLISFLSNLFDDNLVISTDQNDQNTSHKNKTIIRIYIFIN
jgi:hypothetical protein